ncbi:T9SS type A sorting domain-containing protein [Salibacteraceae bacterium]|nr:T9SS type A sorting domain-containing protein [Salibacteraceae bacterium]
MKRTITLLLTVLTLNSFSQSITVELNTTQTLQDSDAGSVAYADIDLDGDNDLLITGNGPTTGVTSTLYENDGSGNFTAVSQPAIVNVYNGAAEFADVDSDGDMDLMMTGNTSSPSATANLYINDGTGNFTISSGTPFEASNSGDIDFGDIDGDSDLDLIMTGLDASGNAFSKLYLNDGMGIFTLVSGTSFTPVWSSSTEFIDVDNDGDLDLLICGANSSGASTTNMYENNGTGTFSLVAGVPFDNVQFGDIAFGDTDNDGDLDILIVGQNDSSQYIAKLYINSGTSFSLLSNTPFPGTFLHSASFADFNNDGKLDLLHVGNASNGLIGHIYENQGFNNFTLADSTLRGSYNGSHIVADLNGDNKMDIVTTGTSFTSPFRAPKIYFNQTASVSVNELNDDLGLIIFPNPSSGLISVKINSASPTDIVIYDITGRVILSDTFFGNLWNTQLKQGPGKYIMQLVTDNKVYTRKITLK